MKAPAVFVSRFLGVLAAALALYPATPKSAEVSIEGLKIYYDLLRAGGEKHAQGEFDFVAATANELVREALTGRN